VIGIIAILVGILLPSLAAARASALSVACQSNLRQLAQASLFYANDNQGYFPPAHLDFITKNLHRWHGTRPNANSPFEFKTSVLQPTLGSGEVRRCGAVEFPEERNYNVAFEAACGGYGYNDTYIGSSMGVDGGQYVGVSAWERNICNVPAKISQLKNPSETILFADSAMGQASSQIIEYSFITPPTFSSTYSSSPTLHFRHRLKVNVAWADSHVSSESMDWTEPQNVYGADNRVLMLGWFGPRNNSLFDRD